MKPTRRRTTHALAATLAATALALSGPAWADDTGPRLEGWSDTELGRMIERELDRAFDQLEETLDSLPLYALPEVTEDGDIIIRRLPRRPEAWPPAPDDPDAMIDL